MPLHEFGIPGELELPEGAKIIDARFDLLNDRFFVLYRLHGQVIVHARGWEIDDIHSRHRSEWKDECSSAYYLRHGLPALFEWSWKLENHFWIKPK